MFNIYVFVLAVSQCFLKCLILFSHRYKKIFFWKDLQWVGEQQSRFWDMVYGGGGGGDGDGGETL